MSFKGHKHSAESKKKMSHFHGTPEQRFENNIIKGKNKNDCWKWDSKSKLKFGYGYLKINQKKMLAHRFSYILYFGEIPKGLHILHKCNNPECCNPLHLYAGTQQDNMNDKIKANHVLRGEQIGNSKLTKTQVLEIRSKYIPRKYSSRKLAKEYNVHCNTILHAIKDTWQHI